MTTRLGTAVTPQRMFARRRDGISSRDGVLPRVVSVHARTRRLAGRRAAPQDTWP